MSGHGSGGRTFDARRASLAAVLGLVVALLGVVATIPPARAAGPLTCNPHSIFNLDISGNVYSLNPATRANTLLGTINTGGSEVNALGVTPGAPGTGNVTAYAAAQNATAVYSFDGTTTTRTPVTPPTGNFGTVVMGAVDPESGIYYYAAYGNIPNPGPRFLRIFAFDPNAPGGPAGLGEVARVPESNSATTAGDFAFDLSGNLFILIGRPGGAGAAATSIVVRVNAADLPDTAVGTPAALQVHPITDFPTPTGSFWNGIAFGADADLYAQTTATGNVASLATINPNDPGTVSPALQTFATGFPAGNPNDLASCSTPGTLTAQKDLTRAAAGDQFTMSITPGGSGTTTAGSTDGLQGQREGPIPGVPSTVYTIREQLSHATDTSINAYNAPSLTCVNTNTNAEVTPQPTSDPRAFTLAFPAPVGVEGANILCTFTNTPAPPRLTFSKALGGSGRIIDTDQFTMEIRTGSATGPIVGDTTNATTTGTGDEVTLVTGTTSVSPATAGPYFLTEDPSGTTALGAYEKVIECTDENGVQTGLPHEAFTGSVSVDPVPGADIHCVLTNTPITQSILELNKDLGSDRVDNTDQFTVSIQDPTGANVPVEGNANPTTDGDGSTVLTGTGTTGFVPVSENTATPYTLTVAEAGSPTVNPATYTATITCVDYAGLQTGLPTHAPFNGSFPLTIQNRGSEISCTVTNTANQPTLRLAKALAGPRANAADQFTMQILRDDQTTVAGTTAHDTTQGTGGTVTTGTGVTDLTPAAAGDTYYLDEIPAAGTPTDLRQYASSLNCTDANSVQTGLPSNRPFTGFFQIMPQLGAQISCTITNKPIPPEIGLDKALGSKRVFGGDQFRMKVLRSGTVVGTTANATTAGTGAFVRPGTGATVRRNATAGTRYTLTEAAAGSTLLANYSKRIACTDNAGIQTGLPQGAFPGTAAVTPRVGASIACTITNTARPPAQPRVRTATSDRRVNTGQRFRDTIRVSGLRGRVRAIAGLYGPFTTRAEATCTSGSRVRSTSVTVSNGANRTPVVRVNAPGSYTWRVALQANSANRSATHACGQAVETTVVAKPSYRGPAIKGGFTGTVGPSVRAVAVARRTAVTIRMPSIGMRAPVVPERIVGRHMVLPSFTKVGWLRKSDSFGDKIGTVVVGGHVSSRRDRPGPLFRLKEARNGSLVTVTKAGKTYTYKVTGKAIFSRRLPIPQRYFVTTGRPTLVMVSCTGRKSLPRGRFTYTKYVIVVARQIR